MKATKERIKRAATLMIIAVSLLLLPVSVSFAQNVRDMFVKVNPATVVIKTLEFKGPQLQRENDNYNLNFGSGVLISSDGLIMTAAHVVQTAEQILVEFIDGEEIFGRVVHSAPYADVALIQLEQPHKSITPAKLGNSDNVSIGDQTFVIGAPYGLRHTLTVGYISGRHASKTVIGNLTPLELFQTDAAINSGNSGGPMFNMNGEVIGIVSYILTLSGGFEGLGFAVTSNLSQELLIKQKAFWTGIKSYLLIEYLAEIFNLPQSAGLLVAQVASGSPYAKLGLKSGYLDVQFGEDVLTVGGDIILEVGGINVPDDIVEFQNFSEYVSSLKKGDTLSMKILRAGKIIDLNGLIN